MLCLLALGLKAPVGETAPAPVPPRSINGPQTSDLSRTPLIQFIRDLVIPGERSEAFKTPLEADRRAFTQVVIHLLGGDMAKAAVLAAPLHYEILRLRSPASVTSLAGRSVLLSRGPLWGNNPQSSVLYFITRERRDGFRGQGTYIISPLYQRNIVLEVPHPLFDSGTLEEGARILQEAGARGLFIAGTHRCASQMATPCQAGKTDVCGGVYRISDVAHNTGNFFQAAHQATLQVSNSPLVISLHAFRQGVSEPLVILSDGTVQPSPPFALVNRLQEALAREGVPAANCNARGRHPSLCGRGNVQGRLSNRAPDACHKQAVHGSGRFLHLEQGQGIVANPLRLIRALQFVYPGKG